MKTVIIAFVSFIFKLLPSFLVIFMYDMIKPFSQAFFTGIRYCIVKRLCSSVGKKVIIGSNVTIKHWKGITFGDGVSIHDLSYIDGYGSIRIGNNVSIAHNCTLISSHHTWNDRSLPIRLNPIEKRPIVIEDNIWIGCDVRVLGGVKVGKNVIIGAGTIVTKEINENGIYIGNPLKLYKELYNN